MNAYLPLAAAVALTAAAGAGFWKGQQIGRDAEIAARARADEAADRAVAAALKVTAEAIEKIEVRHQTIRQEIQREVREVPVYRDAACRVSPRGMHLVNEALTGEAPATADSDRVPAADAP